MNVNLDAKELRSWVKELPYKFILLLISLISALLVFLPDLILSKFLLLELRNKIGTFLGLIFIVSFCLTVFVFVVPCFRGIQFRRQFSGKRAIEKFNALSVEEKSIVKYMYRNRVSNIILPGNNTAIVHLKNMLMISEVNNIGTMLGTVQLFSYFLQPWVVDLLDTNSDLLKGISTRLPQEFEKYIEFVGL